MEAGESRGRVDDQPFRSREAAAIPSPSVLDQESDGDGVDAVCGALLQLRLQGASIPRFRFYAAAFGATSGSQQSPIT
jgi:hypothetical protein